MATILPLFIRPIYIKTRSSPPQAKSWHGEVRCSRSAQLIQPCCDFLQRIGQIVVFHARRVVFAHPHFTLWTFTIILIWIIYIGYTIWGIFITWMHNLHELFGLYCIIYMTPKTKDPLLFRIDSMTCVNCIICRICILNLILS